jgi:peptide deformylase
MIRPIVTVSPGDLSNINLSLFRRSDAVVAEDECLVGLVQDLIDTMHAHSICVGLAAVQIGINKQVIVINTSKDPTNGDIVMLNPHIISTYGKKDIKHESCMSLPDWTGDVERRSKVVVAFTDLQGNEQELSADGYLSRAIQHEIDHLAGKLYAHLLIPGTELSPTELFRSDIVRK